MINIRKLEAELWESADLLRAGSKLTSNQYCMPVLGLIEHKFVKVHAYILWDGIENQELRQDSFYHINGRALLQHTMDLLEIVREWLIDLTMAIHVGEEKRSEKYQGTAMATMPLIEFEDEWKK